ncbi:MAG: ATPase [Herpetosiphonaceae bacterium]|nr:MAG: ATPase [Herpetosiphonaceae bacterium]
MAEQEQQEQFAGFSREALEALEVPGIAGRWAAVQSLLHPPLALLLAEIDRAGRARFPLQWPLYEVSYKSQRYINRGAAGRAPIEEYHAAIDRPPRGCGIYVGVSGSERAILVGLQLWRARKDELRRVWESARALWLPLVESLPEVRFAGRSSVAAHETWMDQYLRLRGAGYLWAGYSYSWDDPLVGTPAFAERVAADVLSLFPLNEALMEQAEELPAWGRLLEERAPYGAFALPPVEEIIERIHARGFAYPDQIVRAYHLALQTKPLVILPGISGTGKTRLTRLYADAIHGVPLGHDNPFYLLVAVQPDWHNARDLLGYYNALTGRFHPTPLMRFLMRATADPAHPYYVCLDELNLARPEYYLAPLLSALETTEHEIDLGAPTEQVETVTGEVLRNPFRLPLNVLFTGTVNVDESTHALSDKLLDRANVIELTDVDLEAFRRSYRRPINERAWRLLQEIQPLLREAGHPFGYRAASEILRYIEASEGGAAA